MKRQDRLGQLYEAIAASDPELARIVAAAHVANSEHWLRADLARIETADGASEPLEGG